MPKARSRAAGGLIALLALLAPGCGSAVQLVQDTGHGGIVIYPYRAETGQLLTPRRAEAIQLIEQRCRGAYTIVREGETRGRSRMIENAAGTEVIAERRWGVQFRCKEADP